MILFLTINVLFVINSINLTNKKQDNHISANWNYISLQVDNLINDLNNTIESQGKTHLLRDNLYKKLYEYNTPQK